MAVGAFKTVLLGEKPFHLRPSAPFYITAHNPIEYSFVEPISDCFSAMKLFISSFVLLAVVLQPLEVRGQSLYQPPRYYVPCGIVENAPARMYPAGQSPPCTFKVCNYAKPGLQLQQYDGYFYGTKSGLTFDTTDYKNEPRPASIGIVPSFNACANYKYPVENNLVVTDPSTGERLAFHYPRVCGAQFTLCGYNVVNKSAKTIKIKVSGDFRPDHYAKEQPFDITYWVTIPPGKSAMALGAKHEIVTITDTSNAVLATIIGKECGSTLMYEDETKPTYPPMKRNVAKSKVGYYYQQFRSPYCRYTVCNYSTYERLPMAHQYQGRDWNPIAGSGPSQNQCIYIQARMENFIRTANSAFYSAYPRQCGDAIKICGYDFINKSNTVVRVYHWGDKRSYGSPSTGYHDSTTSYTVKPGQTQKIVGGVGMPVELRSSNWKTLIKKYENVPCGETIIYDPQGDARKLQVVQIRKIACNFKLCNLAPDVLSLKTATNMNLGTSAPTNKCQFLNLKKTDNLVLFYKDSSKAMHFQKRPCGSTYYICGFTVFNDSWAPIRVQVDGDEYNGSYDTTSILSIEPGSSAMIAGGLNGAVRILGLMKGQKLHEYKDKECGSSIKYNGEGMRGYGLKPSFTIKTGVAKGAEDGSSCAGSDPTITAAHGDKVTVCFNVTNSGDTYLDGLKLSIPGYDKPITSDGSLAPGESRTVLHTMSVDKDVSPIVTINARATFEDGSDVPRADPLDGSATFSVKVPPPMPAIRLEAGAIVPADDSSSCSGATTPVTGAMKDAVLYCFQVTNIGNTYLSSLLVASETLGYNHTINRSMAPGDSKTLKFEGDELTSSVTSVVIVTGIPSTKDGDRIDSVDDVESSDVVEVNAPPLKPDLSFIVGVHPGGKDETKDCSAWPSPLVVRYGQQVAYCLQVKNTGDTNLSEATAKIADLDFKATFDKPLSPGDSHTFHHIYTPLDDVNTEASVSAVPTLKDGSSVPGFTSPLTDSELVLVKVPEPAPELTFKMGVFKAGDGTSCADAKPKVETSMGENVVFCFSTTNTGNTHLNLVTTSTELDFKNVADTPLAPGETRVLKQEKTLHGDISPNGKVVGTPALKDGKVIDLVDRVEATDKIFGVDVADVSKLTVSGGSYLGDVDPSNPCIGSPNRIRAAYGEKITYCFKVSNDGETELGDIVVKLRGLALEKTIKHLPPSQNTASPSSKIVSFTVPVKDDTTTKAMVVARVKSADGSDAPGIDPVEKSVSLSVVVPDPSPNVALKMSVYEDGLGLSCADSRRSVDVEIGANLVFCFTMANQGNTYLNLDLTSTDLDYVQSFSKPLGPGQSLTVEHRTDAVNDANPAAIVLGTPVISDGSPTDLEKVTSIDSVGVDVADSPDLSVTVGAFVGDMGDGQEATHCSNATDVLDAVYGQKVNICFLVKNNGETNLGDLVLNAPELGYSDSIDNLKSGDSKLMVQDLTAKASTLVRASVSAVPILSDGTAAPDMDPLSSKSTLLVVVPKPEPRVSLKMGVFPTDDDSLSCSSALPYVEVVSNTSLTYCFTVSNEGNTLADISLSSPELGYYKDLDDPLAPGGSKTLKYVSMLTDDGDNDDETFTGKAMATPLYKPGSVIDGVGPASDEDKVVAVTKAAPVVLTDVRSATKTDSDSPKNNSTAAMTTDQDNCLQTNWEEAGNSDTLVCAKRIVSVNSATSDTAVRCKPGDQVQLKIVADLSFLRTVYDFGWYVAKDGGDALTGTCSSGTFQQDPSPNFKTDDGKVVWAVGDDGDGDSCPDVKFDGTGATVTTNMDMEVLCQDAFDDGQLSINLCFTWKCDSTNSKCVVEQMVPGATTDSCYCTGVSIDNTEVYTPSATAC